MIFYILGAAYASMFGVSIIALIAGAIWDGIDIIEDLKKTNDMYLAIGVIVMAAGIVALFCPFGAPYAVYFLAKRGQV